MLGARLGAQGAARRSRRWALGERARCRRAGRAVGAAGVRGARGRAWQQARALAEQGWLGGRRAG